MSCYDSNGNLKPYHYAHGSSGGIIDLRAKNRCDRGILNLTNATVEVRVLFESGTEITATDVAILDAEAGKVRWTLTPTETAEIGRHFYELYVNSTMLSYEDVSDRYKYTVFDPIGPDTP